MSNIQITNEDNIELMARYPDGYFDLAIVDPPFGIGNFVQTGGNVRGEAVTWNDNTPTQKYFDELKRVSKNRIIFGANYYNCFEGKYGAIIWVKNQPMPNFSKAVIASCSMHKKIELYNKTFTNDLKMENLTQSYNLLKNYFGKNLILFLINIGLYPF